MGLCKTPAAEQDLLAIWDYIAADNVPAADRMLRRFENRFKQLIKFPLTGESQDRFRANLRSVVEGACIIFYEPCPDEILIYRILHGARRWEDLLS